MELHSSLPSYPPDYVYAYAFGELLVLALYARYQKVGASFAEKYVELLESGGSDWPHVLVGKLDINLNDPDFWKEGLSAIEDMVVKAEKLAEEEETEDRSQESEGKSSKTKS